MINFLSEDISIPQNINANTKAWIQKVIESHNKQVGTLSYVFCNDEYILYVNKTYLQHDYYTDIITFDECTSSVISGDLVISLDTVQSNSIEFKQDFNKELHRVIIHGILHLIGFKDFTDSEKQIMRQQEDKALSLLSTFH
ncbi:rRNA maturation RNase YbeY [Carboxylicivirga sp. M1479]|uniref:rRNA maturation RNase YbeY n=1 Tax=Carboxylicivirga sp. M1479 TaxID=2594476 RepID=UPI0011775C1E|nr:rRNA maturation RNase YbeY [Carboxylicivirga sp. M1479]TRX71663.1 rRNA maturation RNase YbeY [Carboxylicivirga sp. M1479]